MKNVMLGSDLIKMDKFKATEKVLYDYKSLDIKIKNIQIDIETLKNDITLKAISYEERTGKTNAFSSSIENEVIHREEYIQEQINLLQARLKYYQSLKIKVEGALMQLTDHELKLVELRYFSKEKKTWEEVGQKLNYTREWSATMRNGIINKLSSFIFP